MIIPNPITQVADMPYALYLSLQGKYFVGYADQMWFENGNMSWAGLINPINSGVNLHVFVWTATNTSESPLIAQVWFNSGPVGQIFKSEFITPANTTITPLPQPRVKLLQANNVTSLLKGGEKILAKTVLTEVTLASDEDGKLIFPPGGTFIVTLSNSEAPDEAGEGRVAFGWSEEKIY